MANQFTFHIVAEDDLTAAHHASISDLLCRAFPKFTHIFANASYYFGRPEFRLWMEDEAGTIIAHLDVERRVIDVNGRDMYIAGVGEVATAPDLHRKGVGRLLLDKLNEVLRDTYPVDYGFLRCRDELIPFYGGSGWLPVTQPTHMIDINTGEKIVELTESMYLPVLKTAGEWGTEGIVDLRGLSW